MTTQLSLPLRRLGRTNKMVTPIGLGGATVAYKHNFAVRITMWQ